MRFREGGSVYGLHRVVEPHGCLPQAAQKLDSTLPGYDNEIIVSLSALQIDSASFHQLSAISKYPDHIKTLVADIVVKRGKMHNPVTLSGGIFLGNIAAIGPHHPLRSTLKEGDQVVSLVSLSLTPINLTEIKAVDTKKERLFVSGHAVLFASGILAKMAIDLPEGVVLAALDVCGAPAQAARLAKPGNKILVIGLGKAGRSVALQAALKGAQVFGVDAQERAVNWCQKNISGTFNTLDATNPIAVYEWMMDQGGLADIVIHATNVDSTEMSGVLPCKEGGTVLFFGMNTSFQKAVLGAEGLGKDVNLMMGNGYVPGHADLMLNLVRQNRPLREWFEESFG
jgi:L-erythro-3,5-diaminohexanoate dehydrogenase